MNAHQTEDHFRIYSKQLDLHCGKLNDILHFAVHQVPALPREVQRQNFLEDFLFISTTLRIVISESRRGTRTEIESRCLHFCICATQAYCSQVLIPSNLRPEIRNVLSELGEILFMSKTKNLRCLSRNLDAFLSQLQGHHNQSGLANLAVEAPLNAIGA